MNGIWLLFLLGRLSMFTGWRDLVLGFTNRGKKEFVSADARLDDYKRDTRSYEMLSRDCGKTMDDVVTPSAGTPISPLARPHLRSPSPVATKEYPFSYSSESNDGRRTPDYFGHTVRYHTPARSFSSPRPPQSTSWDARETYAAAGAARHVSPHGSPENNDPYMNPLAMNQI